MKLRFSISLLIDCSKYRNNIQTWRCFDTKEKIREIAKICFSVMDFKFLTPMPMLFTSPEVEEAENDESRVKFQDLPLELHIKILSLIDLTDLLAYSTTCKTFYRNSNSQQLW